MIVVSPPQVPSPTQLIVVLDPWALCSHVVSVLPCLAKSTWDQGELLLWWVPKAQQKAMAMSSKPPARLTVQLSVPDRSCLWSVQTLALNKVPKVPHFCQRVECVMVVDFAL